MKGHKFSHFTQEAHRLPVGAQLVQRATGGVLWWRAHCECGWSGGLFLFQRDARWTHAAHVGGVTSSMRRKAARDAQLPESLADDGSIAIGG